MSERFDLNFEAPRIIPRKKRKKDLALNPLSESNIQTVKEKKKFIFKEVKKKKEKKIQTAVIKEEITEEKNHTEKRLIKRESGNPNPEKLLPSQENELIEKTKKSEEDIQRLNKVEEKTDEEIESLSKWFNTAGDEDEDELSYLEEEKLDNINLSDNSVPEIQLDNNEQVQEDDEIEQIEEDFEELKNKVKELEENEGDESINLESNDTDSVSSNTVLNDKTDDEVVSQEAQDNTEANTESQEQTKITEDDGELTLEWENFLKKNSDNNDADGVETQNIESTQGEEQDNDNAPEEKPKNEEKNLEVLEDNVDSTDSTNPDSAEESIGNRDVEVKNAETQDFASLQSQIEGQRNLILELQKELKNLKQEKDKSEKPLTEKEKRQKRFQDKLQAGEKLGFFGGGSNVEIHDYTNPAKVKIEKIFDDSKPKKSKLKPFNLIKWIFILIGLSTVFIILLIIYFCFTQEIQPDCGCIQIKELVEKIF